MEQGTSCWRLARLGKATSSRIADIIARTKSGYSTSRANYAAQLACERLTGIPAESYVNAAMVWGVEKEPEARRLYEFEQDVAVRRAGFLDHATIAMSGASPDGFVGDDGLVEFKCPITATHIATLLGQTIPSKYAAQIQWQMAVTGRAWCDFVSYNPRLPPAMRLFVQRIPRDPILIGALEREVERFLAEVDATLIKLKTRTLEGRMMESA
jgi:putative phage-type endonuclease